MYNITPSEPPAKPSDLLKGLLKAERKKYAEFTDRLAEQTAKMLKCQDEIKRVGTLQSESRLAIYQIEKRMRKQGINNVC